MQRAADCSLRLPAARVQDHYGTRLQMPGHFNGGVGLQSREALGTCLDNAGAAHRRAPSVTRDPPHCTERYP